MVYRRVLLVFFSTFNVVFNEPSCFNALICFNEPFYIYASINFCTLLNLFALVVQCDVLNFALVFFSTMSFLLYLQWACMFQCLTCFNKAFYLSTSINLSTSLSCGLLKFYVSFLFYSNIVLSEPLCFSDLFLLQTSFLPFYSMSLFDSMDNDILCSKVLIFQWAFLL
jgi:hypothetical protein